jgi:hypothetical protein
MIYLKLISFDYKTLDELIKMKNLTISAFKEGKR